MFSGFKKAANMAVGMATGKEIFSDAGKAKLQQVSMTLQGEIQRLGSENPASAEIVEALSILRKIKALTDKLVTLNTWQLIALGSLESGVVDPKKPIETLSLEELVQDLLLDRDIYWDIKNKQLHTSLADLFATLKSLEETDFGAAGVDLLSLIGGIQKIHAVGIILSALLPFYQMATPLAGVSDYPYHPKVPGTLFGNLRNELGELQHTFFETLKATEDLDKQKELIEQYKKDYAEKVKPFLSVVKALPGEDIFLETKNTTFNAASVLSFRPQGGILRGLLQLESSFNTNLQKECPDLLQDNPNPLNTTYVYLNSELKRKSILQRRTELFQMIQNTIITPFEQYIIENGKTTGLPLKKATLLQQFLANFIHAKNDLFFRDGTWRTADKYERGEFYTCFEVAQKLITTLIEYLRAHDAMCKEHHKGVGRTGILFANAIAAAANELAVPYDVHSDDTCFIALSDYEKAVGLSPSQTSSSAASASSSSSGSNAAGKEEEKEEEKGGAVTSSPSMGMGRR